MSVLNYKEIQNPRKRKGIIDFDRLMNLLGFDNYDDLKALGYKTKGRKIISANDTFELREAVAPFGNADNLDSGNTYLWNQ